MIDKLKNSTLIKFILIDILLVFVLAMTIFLPIILCFTVSPWFLFLYAIPIGIYFGYKEYKEFDK